MERKYLAATLALAATFLVFSYAFDSGRLAKLPHSRAEAQAQIACARRTIAQRLMAKLEPYVESGAPEQAQMVAELNLPDLVRVEEQAAEAQRFAQEQVARQKCQAALRAQKAAQQVFEMRILSNDRAQRVSDLAVIRAEDLSARAQEWRAMVDAGRIEINVKAIERAQQVSARAIERAQRAIERSRVKMASPQLPGMPIHINFVAPVPVDFTVAAPVAPEPPSPTIY